MAKSIYIYCSEHGPFDGNSCKLCEDKPENQIARLRAALAEAQAERDRALAFARKAGHLLWCSQLTMKQGWSGKCTCGLAELGVE